jgi:DNA polymerase-1
VQVLQPHQVVALAAGDGSAAWLDVDDLDADDDGVLAGWLADPAMPKVLHDAKGPMLAMAARGWDLVGVERDTALSAYLARPDQRSFDLADLTLRYLKRELKAGAEPDEGQLSFDSIGDGEQGDSAMLQARAVLDLAAALDDELEARGGTRLLADVELPLDPGSQDRLSYLESEPPA